jgi:squalene synthase HpnC
VPSSLRAPIHAIYAFARSADDIADEGDDPPATRLAKLDAYGAMLDRIEAGETPADAPFNALAKAIRRHALPLVSLRDLLSAFRQDVVKSRYASFDELLDYCQRSANPIGRLLLHLYDRTDDANLRRSDAICTGLQLANFWQDIALDWAKGRVYVPADDMARYAVAEAQIALARTDDNWTRLVNFEIERTRALLDSGRPLATVLPLRLRLELKLVIAGGCAILDQIGAVRGDVFRHRPTLRKSDWLLLGAGALTR